MTGESRPPFDRIRRFTESDGFESVIATLLVSNGLVLLLETFVDVSGYDGYLWLFFAASQVVFVGEIGLRVLGYGPRFKDFFREGWNVFDFVVVAASFAPMVGPLSYVARIVRVLRVLRVVALYARRKRRGES